MDGDTSRPVPVSPEVLVPVGLHQEGLQNQATTGRPPPAAEIQRSTPGVFLTAPNPSNSNAAGPTHPFNSSNLNNNPSRIPSAGFGVEVPRLTRSPVSFDHERDANSGASRSTDQDLTGLPERIIPLQIHHPDPRARPLSTHRVSQLTNGADESRKNSSYDAHAVRPSITSFETRV